MIATTRRFFWQAIWPNRLLGRLSKSSHQFKLAILPSERLWPLHLMCAVWFETQWFLGGKTTFFERKNFLCTFKLLRSCCQLASNLVDRFSSDRNDDHMHHGLSNVRALASTSLVPQGFRILNFKSGSGYQLRLSTSKFQSEEFQESSKLLNQNPRTASAFKRKVKPASNPIGGLALSRTSLREPCG